MSGITEFLKLYTQLEFGGCCVLISDHTNDKWVLDDGEVYWKDKDGSFYSGHMPEGMHYEGEYAICNVDTMGGQWTTCFFLIENKDENLSEDDEYEEDE